ncbi:MAG: mobile mystery protein B [Gammaproteobacteria bacterium]|nr:mobile mystery protein B [Gammaproteobacteria bacterium]
MKFEYVTGATPLDPDEKDSLLPTHITTQNQLNEWEQANILEAENWAFARHQSHVLELGFCRNLHKKMFDKTWLWAGKFRHSNKNIGVFWEQVSTHLRLLLDDMKFQIKNNSYELDEIAARFHHRLAFIHPFPNGNGRHARLMTDILLFNQGAKQFTWGQTELTSNNQARISYIAALRAADKGNYDTLFRFVRS